MNDLFAVRWKPAFEDSLVGASSFSLSQGRELFNHCVLKHPNRSDPVGLGLEVLLQCLVQDDGLFSHTMEEQVGGHVMPLVQQPVLLSSFWGRQRLDI